MTPRNRPPFTVKPVTMQLSYDQRASLNSASARLGVKRHRLLKMALDAGLQIATEALEAHRNDRQGQE